MFVLKGRARIPGSWLTIPGGQPFYRLLKTEAKWTFLKKALQPGRVKSWTDCLCLVCLSLKWEYSFQCRPGVHWGLTVYLIFERMYFCTAFTLLRGPGKLKMLQSNLPHMYFKAQFHQLENNMPTVFLIWLCKLKPCKNLLLRCLLSIISRDERNFALLLIRPFESRDLFSGRKICPRIVTIFNAGFYRNKKGFVVWKTGENIVYWIPTKYHCQYYRWKEIW